MADDLTGTDLIRAGQIVSAYTAHFSGYMTKRRRSDLTDLAIKLNNSGVGRPD